MNSAQLRRVRRKKKKKELTKDDIIDKMRDLNTRARDKLKQLNSRMERVLDTIKYKVIYSKPKSNLCLEQQLKQRETKETPEHKQRLINSEILALKQQKEVCEVEIEQLKAKIEEAINFKPQYISKENPNKEILKKTIRDLKKEIKDQGNILIQLNGSAPKKYNTNELSNK